MNIHLLAIGKRMPSWVESGYQQYADRLPHDYRLNLIEIDSKPRAKSADITRILQAEGKQLLNKVPKHSLIIALDRQGKALNTEQIAGELLRWHDDSQDISLLIGGPEGLSNDCLQAATQTWSLSKLTLPHPLVRVLIAEQIYRAFSILSHHPYHR